MAKSKKKKAEVKESSEEVISGSIQITRSFARKLNMNAHGGKQYETADIVCTVTATVEAEEREEASKMLDQYCQDDVNATIAALDEEADEEGEEEEVDAKPKPEAKKKMIDVGVKVSQDEMEEIQELINDLTMAKTPEDLKKAVIKIKNDSEELSRDQKNYLNAYFKKRKEAIEE